jgi:Holliday junction resolvasome RuvABC endonuclease subunit
MLVMGIDPGGTTGVAWLNLESGESSGFEVKCKKSGAYSKYMELELNVVDEILGVVEKVDPNVVCIEGFVLRLPCRSSAVSGLSPVRIGFGIHHGCRRLGIDVVYFQPGQAKGAVTDERLRECGHWVVGSAHVRDAWRQVLLYERILEAG